MAVYVLDDNGRPPQYSKLSQEHSLICVFKQNIKIYLFRQNGTHSLFQERRTDLKDGLIVTSGVFIKDSGSFLGVLLTSGLLMVHSLPDLSTVFKDNITINLR